MVPEIKKLLPQVRRWILTEASKGKLHFGLSHAVHQFSPSRYLYPNTSGDHLGETCGARYTSCALKTYRGRVQACLSILAREGLMYGRNHAEGGVQCYAHGETDKRFHIRIKPTEALKRLANG